MGSMAYPGSARQYQSAPGSARPYQAEALAQQERTLWVGRGLKPAQCSGQLGTCRGRSRRISCHQRVPISTTKLGAKLVNQETGCRTCNRILGQQRRARQLSNILVADERLIQAACAPRACGERG